MYICIGQAKPLTCLPEPQGNVRSHQPDYMAIVATTTSHIMEFRWIELLMGRSTGRSQIPIEMYQWVDGLKQWVDSQTGEYLHLRGRRLIHVIMTEMISAT